MKPNKADNSADPERSSPSVLIDAVADLISLAVEERVFAEWRANLRRAVTEYVTAHITAEVLTLTTEASDCPNIPKAIGLHTKRITDRRENHKSLGQRSAQSDLQLDVPECEGQTCRDVGTTWPPEFRQVRDDQQMLSSLL